MVMYIVVSSLVNVYSRVRPKHLCEVVRDISMEVRITTTW